MSPTECVCFKPTRLEQELGLDEAIRFYEQEIALGSTESDHFERLAALLRHSGRLAQEVEVLEQGVRLHEKLVFEEHLGSALASFNALTLRLKQARKLAEAEPARR